MKKNLILVLLMAYIFTGCKKDNTANSTSNWFLIEVRESSNQDCKVPEVIFVTRKQEAYQIIGNSSGYYIASGLPKVLYAAGTRLNVAIQKPDNLQLLMCTSRGPAFPQVHITAIK